MSNQNKGADSRSCPWCVFRNALFLAAHTEIPEHCRWDLALRLRVWQSISRRLYLLTARCREITPGGDCETCQRSLEIQQGDMFGPKRRAWRKRMWKTNPTMRQFMRQGVHDAELSR
jgi:hypothetical protein